MKIYIQNIKKEKQYFIKTCIEKNGTIIYEESTPVINNERFKFKLQALLKASEYIIDNNIKEKVEIFIDSPIIFRTYKEYSKKSNYYMNSKGFRKYKDIWRSIQEISKWSTEVLEVNYNG